MNCIICNKEIKNYKGIPLHLKHVHNMSYCEYVCKYIDEYPDNFSGWHRCNICGKITRNTRTCSKECGIIYRKTVLIGENHPFFNHHHSKKTKAKIGESQKIRLKRDGHPRTGVVVSEETISKIRTTQINNTKKPDYVHPCTGKKLSLSTIKKIMKKRSMTIPENKIAVMLTDNNIPYYHQFFLTKDGVCKAYDFKIKGKKILIEVDGDYWHGGPACKKHFFKLDEVIKNDAIKDELAEDNGYKLIRIWESDIKNNNIDIVKELT